MGFVQKDAFTRLAEELGELMNRIDASLRAGEPANALVTLADANKRVTGPMGGGLGRLDAGSVIALLGPEKATLYAQLLRLEAQAREALGETAAARAASSRAEALERALPHR